MSKGVDPARRALLRGYCEYVPPRVANGSWNLAVEFKAKVKAARRVLDKERASESEIESAIRSLDSYWRPTIT